MAKQKCDNKTVDIQLLILRDKIECLIGDYENRLFACHENTDQWLYKAIIKDLKGLLESQYE